MAEPPSTAGGGRAAWPLLASFVLLVLAMVVAGPLIEVRGFADGALLCLTPLVAGFVVVMLLSARASKQVAEGSTAGHLSDNRAVPKAGKAVDVEENVDLDGLDLPLV